jgi:site-specific DNA-cytosine methylase
LIFTVREDLRYEAAAVPAQVGMKAGDVVEGFIHGKHKDKIQSIVASKDDVRKEVSLRKLSKKHGIDLEADTLVLEKKARYCTHLVKLDTKDYGLPQTRNRKYLFIWLSDDPNDDLGGYFDKILEHLQTPLLHSVDAFLLPDSHDRIRCFREALRSGPGLMVKRERAKENDFWDPLSRVKDTILHKIFRVQNGLPDRMRWLTEWGTRSRKKLAPGLWPELFDCWNMRRLDMIDCFAGAAIRDAIPRDCLHHLFMWDISQNVTRAPYRSAAVGVSGCVTPGGELLVPHLGRTIMGYEKLLLQGIPFSRLVLGQETEVQCSDLAGNAMSMSVISATILAAVCAPQLRKQSIHNFGVSLKNFRLSLEHDDAKGAVLAARGDLKETARSTIEGAFEDSFQSIARDLSEEAFRSSVLCTCESSGTVSKDPTILQCMGCGWMCCHSCSDRYQTSSHDLFEVNVSEIAHSSRPDPHVFERKLRSAAPSLLCLGEGSEKLLRDGAGLEAYGFQLQQVERKKGHWQLTYGAWEDHGSGRQVAETRVVVGRLSALDSVTGVSAFVRCFAPAIREVRPYRGKLSDSARLQFPKGAEGSNTQWEVPGKSQDADLKIVGSNPVDSLRAMIGLADKAAKDLRSQLVKRSYAFPFQSRNPLTHYPDDWKIWPGTLEVSNDPSCQVNGIYQKLNCRHTICLSALWRREGDKPMYLYFRPNVLRSGLDTAVFSPSPSYADGMEVVELGDWIPENSFHERTQTTKARILSWDSATALTVLAPASSVQLLSQPTPFHESFVNSIRNDLPDPILCELANLPLQVVQSLLEYNNVAGQRVASLDLFGKLGTRNAKRMSIVAAPTLLKAAARGELSLPLSKWLTMPKISVPLGKCPLNVPLPPKERWLKRDDNTFERVYDPKESDEYYQVRASFHS